MIAGLGTPNPKKPRPGSIPGAVRLSSYVKWNGLRNAQVLKSRSAAIPTATPAVYASPRRSQSARAIAYAPRTKPTKTSGLLDRDCVARQRSRYADEQELLWPLALSEEQRESRRSRRTPRARVRRKASQTGAPACRARASRPLRGRVPARAGWPSQRTSSTSPMPASALAQRCSAQITRVGSPVVRMPVAFTSSKNGSVTSAIPGAFVAYVWPSNSEVSPRGELADLTERLVDVRLPVGERPDERVVRVLVVPVDLHRVREREGERRDCHGGRAQPQTRGRFRALHAVGECTAQRL